MIGMADFGRLSAELHGRFPQEEGEERLTAWLASADIEEDEFDKLIRSSIEAFEEMLTERAQEESLTMEAEDEEGNPIMMARVEASNLIGSIACNMFLLGYEVAAQYGKKPRDM